jgi:hypothetical protein
MIRPTEPLVSPPDDSLAHAVRCHVVVSRDAGWDVIAEVDHRVLSSAHCSDWHHVERLRARLRDADSARPPDPGDP